MTSWVLSFFSKWFVEETFTIFSKSILIATVAIQAVCLLIHWVPRPLVLYLCVLLNCSHFFSVVFKKVNWKSLILATTSYLQSIYLEKICVAFLPYTQTECLLLVSYGEAECQCFYILFHHRKVRYRVPPSTVLISFSFCLDSFLEL